MTYILISYFSFHQTTLEEALELRNVSSVENLTNPSHYEAAKRIDRRLSLDMLSRGKTLPKNDTLKTFVTIEDENTQMIPSPPSIKVI